MTLDSSGSSVCHVSALVCLLRAAGWLTRLSDTQPAPEETEEINEARKWAQAASGWVNRRRVSVMPSDESAKTANDAATPP